MAFRSDARWRNRNAMRPCDKSAAALLRSAHFLTIVLTFCNIILFDDKERDYGANQMKANTPCNAQLRKKTTKQRNTRANKKETGLHRK